MNQLYHRKNAFGAREETHGFEFSDQKESVVCPKPRRSSIGVSDSNAGAELLDIILTKVIGEADFQRNRDLVKAAHRDNSQDNYLYCPTATQVGNNEIEHFQMHWMRGEPVIVTNVLEKTSSLSWDPMVMWRAFRGTQKILKEEAHKWALADILNVHCPKHSSKRIGLLNLKKFFHLKGKENLIRMLLWHGSWLTNFVGILSQGPRIAHPEAPATGYMVYLHCKTN
ncbi:hypothetical protein Pint_07069 [Pistacia integerrima]|uniref:Uncharacterized protein n=1 Tax=Pistacia integerrima TaxID=434235 RepID=A0ACC0XTG0_9ROSI|nr:hypothetical protein Pint_07069 [Pistacia integerrima]